MKDKLIKEIAQILFEYDGGIYRNEFLKVMGFEKRHWDDLPQDEKDTFILQSTKEIEHLAYIGALNKLMTT